LEKKPSTRLSQEPCFGVNTYVDGPLLARCFAVV
jgi:hypothetical protein